MAQITIGFSKASTFFPIYSWLIMAAERTPFSHVYIKYTDSELQRDVIFQASHTLVNYMGSTVFDTEETVVQEFAFTISDQTMTKIRQFAIDNAGKPYGFWSVIGLAYVQILAFVGLKVVNPLRDEGSTFVCSELVATILKDCTNVEITEDLDTVTPKDIYAIVSKLPIDLTVAI